MPSEGTSSPDPFDLEALRENPATDAGTEKVLNTVPVRRPPREGFLPSTPRF